MRKRKGFTLIELVVAMAILFILIYMAFASFSYILAFSNYNKQRENVQENISTVMDQIAKELRQCETVQESAGIVVDGVSLEKGNPKITAPDKAETKGCKDILTDPDKYGNLSEGELYEFDDSKQPILRFYIMGQDGKEHRIIYTLGVPNNGGSYTGIPQRYWANTHYEPCEIVYSNETWEQDPSTGLYSWSGIRNQPVTEQVITNFTVIRPSWPNKFIQIVIEAMIKGPTGKGAHKIRYITQITLRQ